VSTDEVYGDVATGHSREDDALRPRSPYSASKAGGEMLVSAYRASYDFPAIVTRGSNTFGHHQYPEKIIPLFITNAIDDLPVPIYGDGTAVRDYIHVQDHCRGIDTALRRGEPGSDYNVGAGGETNGVMVADIVLDLLQKPASLRQFVRDRRGHDRRYAVDTSRLRGLGWAPRVGFADAMRETVTWYRENEPWWRPLKRGDYWDFYRRNYQPISADAGR
jgi:dTDP-glucose 4,6-dehydratase